jgi:hypothetical protein
MGRMSLSAGSRTNEKLLLNFQKMFHVNSKWISELQDSLTDSTSRIALIFVDLDNVPRFFKQISRSMVDALPFEVFIVCSAKSTRHVRWESSGKLHFSLANPTKDAADAVCTVAAAKLDSILVSFERQGDVPLVTVSDDKIFLQVTAPGIPPTQAQMHRKYDIVLQILTKPMPAARTIPGGTLYHASLPLGADMNPPHPHR